MDKLISQRKMLEEFVSLCGPATGDGWDNFGVRDLIMRQPVVDAAPVVHGQWEKRCVDGIEGSAIDTWQSAQCSHCGKYHTMTFLYYFDDFRYCPNCGAKMDGSEQDGECDEHCEKAD